MTSGPTPIAGYAEQGTPYKARLLTGNLPNRKGLYAAGVDPYGQLIFGHELRKIPTLGRG
jgi:hypothetical protein